VLDNVIEEDFGVKIRVKVLSIIRSRNTKLLFKVKFIFDLSKQGVKMGSVVKKRRKRMAKKKHKKLLKKTRIQRRNKK